MSNNQALTGPPPDEIRLLGYRSWCRRATLPPTVYDALLLLRGQMTSVELCFGPGVGSRRGWRLPGASPTVIWQDATGCWSLSGV